MRTLLILCTLAVAAALPAVAPARPPEVIRTGTCSNGADWKLKAKADDGLTSTGGWPTRLGATGSSPSAARRAARSAAAR